MMKLQEESPILTTENGNNFFQKCVTNFFDQNSEDEIKLPQYSVYEVVNFIQQNIDICDTPLNDIIRVVESYTVFKGVNIDEVRLSVLKKKSITKRQRAKNRDKKCVKPIIYTENMIDEDNIKEVKKKRNRISAQKSRDKKKIQIKHLKNENRVLQEELKLVREEKEQLKIALKHQKKDQTTKQNISINDSLKSNFLKVLIFLGLLCMTSVLKNVFNSVQLNQINYKLEKQNNILINLSSLSHKSFFKNQLQQFDQLKSDQSLLSQIKDNLVNYYTELKAIDIEIPQHLQDKLKWAKDLCCSEEVIAYDFKSIM